MLTRRLTDALREGTHSLHQTAERTGIVAAILAGTATRRGYELLLCNLIDAYQALERSLDEHARCNPRHGVGRVALRALYRSPSLVADLAELSGPDAIESLERLPAGAAYANRIYAVAGEHHGAALIGHAYVRYLGDLSGGQMLAARIANQLGIDAAALSFYRFADIDNIGQFKTAYRDTIDQAGNECQAIDLIVAEACIAFEHNIQLAEAVSIAAARPER